MFQKSSMSYSLILFTCSSAFFISGFLLIEKSTLDGTSKLILILISLFFTSSQLLKDFLDFSYFTDFIDLL